jgi:hypothetical protein
VVLHLLLEQLLQVVVVAVHLPLVLMESCLMLVMVALV